MIYPVASELAADRIHVEVTCRVVELARQPYYQSLNMDHCPVKALD